MHVFLWFGTDRTDSADYRMPAKVYLFKTGLQKLNDRAVLISAKSSADIGIIIKSYF